MDNRVPIAVNQPVTPLLMSSRDIERTLSVALPGFAALEERDHLIGNRGRPLNGCRAVAQLFVGSKHRPWLHDSIAIENPETRLREGRLKGHQSQKAPVDGSESN